jgi:hypothetical protein
LKAPVLLRNRKSKTWGAFPGLPWAKQKETTIIRETKHSIEHGSILWRILEVDRDILTDIFYAFQFFKMLVAGDNLGIFGFGAGQNNGIGHRQRMFKA